MCRGFCLLLVNHCMNASQLSRLVLRPVLYDKSRHYDSVAVTVSEIMRNNFTNVDWFN